ncbi:MAG: NAD-dependent epimerase/dehydratase family protein [Geminicoccales bacterium]
MIGVIGGSGFIGTALVRALKQSGHEVRIIDRAPSKAYPEAWTEVDVRDRAALTTAVAGCTTLYHLAAEHRDDVRPATLYHDVNVTGAEHVCAAAAARRIDRIVFTSTAAVYGAADREIDETAPLRPFNEYGRTKLQAEQVFRDWAAGAPERSLTVVRPTVVFGPDNRGNVYTLLAQIARGRAIVIGDGRNRKSLAYVENVADFLVHALSFPPGVAVYNYADKPDPDMNQLVTLAGQAVGWGRTRPIRLPYAFGLGVGLACDLIARPTGRRFAVSAARVRKYRANSQFANARCLATGFTPRHELYDALVAVIRHEFAPGTAAGKEWAFAPPEASREP